MSARLGFTCFRSKTNSHILNTKCHNVYLIHNGCIELLCKINNSSMRTIKIQPCKCGSQICIHCLLFKLIKSQNNKLFLLKQTKLVLLKNVLIHVILLIITQNILRRWIQLQEKHCGTISHRSLSLPSLYLDWFPVALESSLPHAETVASNEITVSPVKHTSLILCGQVCCSIDTTRICAVVDLLRPILDTF